MDRINAGYEPGQSFLEYSLVHARHCPEQAFTLVHGVIMEIWGPGAVMLKPARLPDRYRALVLSCGVHGNETAPIEICQRLLQRIIDGEQSLCHPVLLIFGNLPAIKQGKRFISTNLNRLFDTTQILMPREGDDEFARSRQLERWVDRFYDLYQDARRVHYDLHTAIRDSIHPKFAINPFGQQDPMALQRLNYLGVYTVLLAAQPTTTFSYSSWKRYGAESFTIELGKVHPFGQNNPDDYVRFEQGLSRLCQEKDWGFSEFHGMPQLFQVTRTLNKQFDDFHFSFADDQANFSPFEPGSEIAREGGLIHRIQAGEVIVFPNASVPVGQRTLLLVKPVDHDCFIDTK